MSKKKQSAAQVGNSTPFFARFLEGQKDDKARSDARVEGRRSAAYKKAAAKKSPPLQTLKYPSDSDELHLCPYYVKAADAPKEAGVTAARQTLKYPSDRDEEYVFAAEYVSVKDAPKGEAKAKPAEIRLKKKKYNK